MYLVGASPSSSKHGPEISTISTGHIEYISGTMISLGKLSNFIKSGKVVIRQHNGEINILITILGFGLRAWPCLRARSYVFHYSKTFSLQKYCIYSSFNCMKQTCISSALNPAANKLHHWHYKNISLEWFSYRKSLTGFWYEMLYLSNFKTQDQQKRPPLFVRISDKCYFHHLKRIMFFFQNVSIEA